MVKLCVAWACSVDRCQSGKSAVLAADTNGPVIMIGEKGADMIRADARKA